MPIIKDGNGVIQYTPYKHKDRFDPTGVIPDSAFAVCDEQDPTKQFQLNASALATNTTRIALAPIYDGTLITSSGAAPYASGQMLRHQDGAITWSWKSEPTREAELFEDFFSSVNPNFETGWTRTVSGTGASTSVLIGSAAGKGTFGVVRLTTGTTATGRTALHRGVNNLYLQTDDTEYGYAEFSVRVTTLSTDLEAFDVRVGLGDSTGVATWADGIYFYYDHTASPNWIVRTSIGGSTTETITTVAVSTTNYQRLAATFSASAGLIFYINGVAVAQHVTNIPLEANIGVASQILKTAGLTARTVDIDYVLVRAYYTAVRQTFT